MSIDFCRHLCFLPICTAKCHLQPLAAPVWEVWALWLVVTSGYVLQDIVAVQGMAGMQASLWELEPQTSSPWEICECHSNGSSRVAPLNVPSTAIAHGHAVESFNTLCHVGLKSALASISLGPLLWVAQTSSDKHRHTQPSFLLPRSVTNRQVITGDFVHLTD